MKAEGIVKKAVQFRYDKKQDKMCKYGKAKEKKKKTRYIYPANKLENMVCAYSMFIDQDDKFYKHNRN